MLAPLCLCFIELSRTGVRNYVALHCRSCSYILHYSVDVRRTCIYIQGILLRCSSAAFLRSFPPSGSRIWRLNQIASPPLILRCYPIWKDDETKDSILVVALMRTALGGERGDLGRTTPFSVLHRRAFPYSPCSIHVENITESSIMMAKGISQVKVGPS